MLHSDTGTTKICTSDVDACLISGQEPGTMKIRTPELKQATKIRTPSGMLTWDKAGQVAYFEPTQQKKPLRLGSHRYTHLQHTSTLLSQFCWRVGFATMSARVGPDLLEDDRISDEWSSDQYQQVEDIQTLSSLPQPYNVDDYIHLSDGRPAIIQREWLYWEW